jgi:hypothetical protein
MILLPLVVPPEPAHGNQHAGQHAAECEEQGVDKAILVQGGFVHNSLRCGLKMVSERGRR